MSEKHLKNIGAETTKGALLRALANQNYGCLDFGVLTLSGNAVDQNTFTIGSDVYEIHQINTDTTVNTSGGELNTTDAQSVVSLTAAQTLGVGATIRCEAEYMIVLEQETTYCRVLRGAYGSTIAAHANGVDLFRAAQVVGTGRFAVPIAGTVTNTTVDDLVIAAVNWWQDGYEPRLGKGTGKVIKAKAELTAAQGTSASVVLSATPTGEPLTASETLTNGTITATFVEGQQRASLVASEMMHVATADDVTAGSIRKVLPFTPAAVLVEVYAASTRKVLAWDGAVTVTGKVVDIGNGGSTDWAAGDLLVIKAVD